VRVFSVLENSRRHKGISSVPAAFLGWQLAAKVTDLNSAGDHAASYFHWLITH